MMKKLFTLFIAITLFTSAKAQWATIPDANFVTWLNNNGFSGAMNGNLMDTTNSIIINATHINCSSNNIADLTGIQYFDSLIDLICNNNQLTSLPRLPKYLLYLVCSNNSISHIAEPYPSTLIRLTCNNNLIDSLPSSLINTKLTDLFCQNNHIKNFPSLPITIANINCSHNLITNLDSFSSNFQYLHGSTKKKNLIFDCSYNNISSLAAPFFYGNFDCFITANFNCSHNQITTLGNSLYSVIGSNTTFDCSYNQILFINMGTTNTSSPIQYLNCSHNLITNIYCWLVKLDCSNNLLTSITSYCKAGFINCDSNLISTISCPYGANYWCNDFSCRHNQLSYIPYDFIYGLTQLKCDDNPNLTCLPHHSLSMLSANNTSIQCLPNIGNLLLPWNNFPICLNTPQAYCFAGNINGHVYLDKDTSCIYDSIDLSIQNIKVQLWRKGYLEQQVFTDKYGEFAFKVYVLDTFQIKIDTNNISFYLSCPNQQILTSIISTADSLDYNRDFALQCKNITINSNQIFTPHIISQSNFFRIGRKVELNVIEGNNQYSNLCNNSFYTRQICVKIKNRKVHYNSTVAGFVSPSYASSDSLVWNLSSTSPLLNTFIYVDVDSTAIMGSNSCFDEKKIIGNDTFTNFQCYAIGNSWDPNFKEVLPQNNRLTFQDSVLTYTIHFQNNGNDTAYNVLVKDTLSNALDVSTIQIKYFSNNVYIQTMGNIVVFNFPKINLVDSATNETLSNGFVCFTIKRFRGVSIANIKNRASIYFDLNPAIVTNSTLTAICSKASAFSSTENICNGSTYSFNGNNLTTSGIYYDTLQNYLGCDSFITLNLNVNQSTSKTINQTICNNQTYNLNGTILTQSGTYYDTIQNYFGCDSFITLHLIVKPISSYSFNKTICSNQLYSFNHLLLNSSGIYYDTLINYNGCDSFITLHLIVLPSSSKTIYQTICSNNPVLFNGHLLNSTGKYYDTLTNYVGCDSVITLRLTALPSFNYNSSTITICEGSPYFYNGHVYTTNTQLYDTFKTQLGCDSIVGIKIIAIPAPDTSVVQSGNVLIAQAQHSSFYWYDCIEHQLIPNANDDTFKINHTGNYAVIVKDSLTLCSDTSSCRMVVISGVEEQFIEGSGPLVIYPNPCGDKLLVMSDKLLVNTIEVKDVLGRIQNVRVEKQNTNDLRLMTYNLPSGIYFIKATDAKGNIWNGKFVKE